MDSASVNEPNFGYAWSLGSAFVFCLNNHLLLRNIVPTSCSKSVQQKWKWRNTTNSLIHSFITGLWACFCFWEEPKMAEDPISKYTKSAHLVLSLSLGYFVYDLVDMAMNHRKKSSYELIVHHVLVSLCFGLAVSTRYYLGYGLVALLVEVNSVFLHIRQLMIISNINKMHIMYRINSLLNIVTFILFRILTLGWLIQWLVVHRSEVSLAALRLGTLSLSVILVMNIILFLRVLYADYRRCRS